MTLQLVAVATLALTAWLLAEDWWFWRRQRQDRADRARTEMARVIDEMHAGGNTVRCLMHATPLVVEDLSAHLRLHHQPRAVGAEDRPEWSDR